MLTDVLGIVVAFITIVLLLSILVTGMVQAIASVIRKRHAALVQGIEKSEILQVLQKVKERFQPTDQNAKDLITLVETAVERARKEKRITWIDDKEVIEPLKTAGLQPAGLELVQKTLDYTRRVMEEKFLQWARGLTFGAAVVVAVLFGASVPHILERLENDAELRARVAAAGESLARNPPAEYKPILGKPDGQTDEAAAAADKRARSDLSSFGIVPLEDTSFYWERTHDKGLVVHWTNIVGVLFMAVLLSFGAPFWYRILKELIGFKDALRKKQEAPAEEPAPAGAKK